jgi:hypothetical protein
LGGPIGHADTSWQTMVPTSGANPQSELKAGSVRHNPDEIVLSVRICRIVVQLDMP